MKKIILLVCSILCLSSCQNKGNQANVEEKQYSDTINFRLATLDEAKQLMSAEDNYTRSRSPFDIVSRLQNPEGTVEELNAYALQELREWNDDEKKAIQAITKDLNDSIRKYQYELPLPKEIMLVKSTLKDEGGAGGYTRSNWIALTDKLVSHMKEDGQKRILLHELFHVLTRNSLDFKKEMYQTIGFTVLDEELEYPKDLWDVHITNPDVGRYDSYATFMVDGKAQKCAMLLYANRPYTTGTFFQYLNIGFIPYDENMKPIQENGKTVAYSIDQISDFHEKVGKNTRYIINPEEILADNFVIAFNNQANIPTPELTKKIRNILIKGE